MLIYVDIMIYYIYIYITPGLHRISILCIHMYYIYIYAYVCAIVYFMDSRVGLIVSCTMRNMI